MKVSHSNTLWLGYKLYSSFVLHGRITLLPLPTLPLGRHHSLQHPCYHYLADSCITYEPYTVLLIGKVFGGITDQHSESGCFIFRSLPLFSPSFCSFFHFLFVSFIISRSFSCSFRLSPSSASFVHSYFLAVASFFHLFILFRFTFVLSLYLSFILSLSFLLFILSYILLFFLSLVLPFVLPFRLSFDLFIFHSFILFFSLPTFLSFSLSFFCSFFLTFFCCFFALIILSH